MGVHAREEQASLRRRALAVRSFEGGYSRRLTRDERSHYQPLDPCQQAQSQGRWNLPRHQGEETDNLVQ